MCVNSLEDAADRTIGKKLGIGNGMAIATFHAT